MLRKDRFDEREEDFYEALYTQSQAQFDAYVQTGAPCLLRCQDRVPSITWMIRSSKHLLAV